MEFGLSFAKAIATGLVHYPRFTAQEAAASKGEKHGKLWNLVLSLESAKVHTGRGETLATGTRQGDERERKAFAALRRLGTRYGGDPRPGYGVNKYLDLGPDFRFHVMGNEGFSEGILIPTSFASGILVKTNISSNI